MQVGTDHAVPEALVVGKGLESVQEALDNMKEGVSVRKLVAVV